MKPCRVILHLALEISVIRESLLPRTESFLEFLDVTSVSFEPPAEPQSDLMRRPAMERIHTGPQPDLMCCLTKNSMKPRLLCAALARTFRSHSEFRTKLTIVITLPGLKSGSKHPPSTTWLSNLFFRMRLHRVQSRRSLIRGRGRAGEGGPTLEATWRNSRNFRHGDESFFTSRLRSPQYVKPC